MKNRNFYSIISIVTLSLLIYPIYASERARTSLPKSEQDIIKDAETTHEGAGKRVRKRAEARQLQKKGEQLEKNVKTVTTPLASTGTSVGLLASASGDPHAKMAAAAFKLSITAVEGLGEGIAKIIMAVGRYQERSHEVLSNAEVLLEEIQKSIDKKESLEKKLKELLSIEKPIEPSQSSSRLKQFAKSAESAVKTAEIKVRQATDVLTNAKADREEKVKAIQADIKVANDDYQENIRLLQILLMQDTLSEIDKMIDIGGTIDTLESNVIFFQEARESLSKSKSKRKKQMAKIEKDEATNNKSLLYYLKFQKSPTQTPQELEKSRTELVNKIKQLTELTKRGQTLYLQKREVELDSQVNRTAIVALYKENDITKSEFKALKTQLKALETQLAALGKTAPTKDMVDTTPKQPLETAKSQRVTSKSVQEAAKGQGNTGELFSRETIVEQRKNLRPLPMPSTAKVSGR